MQSRNESKEIHCFWVPCAWHSICNTSEAHHTTGQWSTSLNVNDPSSGLLSGCSRHQFQHHVAMVKCFVHIDSTHWQKWIRTVSSCCCLSLLPLQTYPSVESIFMIVGERKNEDRHHHSSAIVTCKPELASKTVVTKENWPWQLRSHHLKQCCFQCYEPLEDPRDVNTIK